MSVTLIALLPARNAAADLPGYFSSIGQVCDGIVALDDGSTDDTRDLLAAHPLVLRLLTNERRDDYATWDDAANRNRLLAAAAELNPDWIVSIDADERLAADDAAALRSFLETDALPGCAYGFRHISMRGDPDHYVPRDQTVYRLFPFATGQRFPKAKLHFVPVPTSIPRTHWIQTTIRLQHLGSLTAESRLARFIKYAEADPDQRYHADYGHLLTDVAPTELRRWTARPPDLPVLHGAAGFIQDDADADHVGSTLTDAPALSAIIIARDDEATIARSVRSVVTQEVPEPFETIVVVSGSPRTAAVVRNEFPTVTLIELDQPALPGEARNAGLRVARGEFVSFPGSHIELPPGSLAARLRAHRSGFVMVTGVALNGTDTPAGWASYFLDQHQGLPGQRRTVLDHAPFRCSYAREPLLAIGGFPEGIRTAEDSAVNEALTHRGFVALRDPSIRFTHRSPCRTPSKLLRHHFRRGRGRGWMLLKEARQTGGLLTRDVVSASVRSYLGHRLKAIERGVGAADPELRPRYDTARPLITAGAVASLLGFWYEILRPGQGKWSILRGTPVRTVGLIAPDSPGPAILIVRIDEVTREVTAVAVPDDLPSTRIDGARHPLRDEVLTVTESSGPDVADLLSRAVDLPVDDVMVVSANWINKNASQGWCIYPDSNAILIWTGRPHDQRDVVHALLRNPPLPITDVVHIGPDPEITRRAVRSALGVDERDEDLPLPPVHDWWP